MTIIPWGSSAWHAFLRCGLVMAVAIPDATADPEVFFEEHCLECHDAEAKKGDLDLTELGRDFTGAGTFARWLKVHDMIASGEMPPEKKPRPAGAEVDSALAWIGGKLEEAERERAVAGGRTGIRRLTRSEYENTVRDLFDLPGIALKDGLPEDGSAFGFDKNAEALDISHVNVAKYVEAADKTLDLAIATSPEAPVVQKRRISLMNRGGFVAHVVMNGDGVLLRDKEPDPEFPALFERLIQPLTPNPGGKFYFPT